MATRSRVVKIELDHDGFRALLEGDAVRGVVDNVAAGVAARAGDGFKVKTIKGLVDSRRIRRVYAATKEARAAQASDKVLSKAIHGGG